MAHLTEAEIQQAQVIINQAKPNKYELSELYGNAWSSITRKTFFGANFKAAVLDNTLHGIAVYGRGTNNHWKYEVLAK